MRPWVKPEDAQQAEGNTGDGAVQRGSLFQCPSGRRGIAAAGGPMESLRIGVVFRLWRCDEKDHRWREGRRSPSLPKFRSEAGVDPPGKVSPERTRNSAFRLWPRTLAQKIGRFLGAMRRGCREVMIGGRKAAWRGVIPTRLHGNLGDGSETSSQLLKLIAFRARKLFARKEGPSLEGRHVLLEGSGELI
jgi:hypothetical protein